MSLKRCTKDQLDRLCGKFRRDVIKTLYSVQTGHPGGSLSVCEILATLYFEQANVDPANPHMMERDRVILSKGHGAPMLYRVLAEKGFFPAEEMQTLRGLNSRLQGHPCAKHTPGVDLTSGPLGIGLSAGLGVAMGQKLSSIPAHTYVILGDGELDEGTVWEAVMSAYKFKADNLIAIVDHNNVQLDGECCRIMPLLDLKKKFEAFGWHAVECDGHDVEQLNDAIEEAKACKGLPSVVIAHTVKGKGVSFMEGKNAWHGKPIGEADFAIAMRELGDDHE